MLTDVYPFAIRSPSFCAPWPDPAVGRAGPNESTNKCSFNQHERKMYVVCLVGGTGRWVGGWSERMEYGGLCKASKGKDRVIIRREREDGVHKMSKYTFNPWWGGGCSV